LFLACKKGTLKVGCAFVEERCFGGVQTNADTLDIHGIFVRRVATAARALARGNHLANVLGANLVRGGVEFGCQVGNLDFVPESGLIANSESRRVRSGIALAEFDWVTDFPRAVDCRRPDFGGRGRTLDLLK